MTRADELRTAIRVVEGIFTADKPQALGTTLNVLHLELAKMHRQLCDQASVVGLAHGKSKVTITQHQPSMRREGTVAYAAEQIALKQAMEDGMRDVVFHGLDYEAADNADAPEPEQPVDSWRTADDWGNCVEVRGNCNDGITITARREDGSYMSPLSTHDATAMALRMLELCGHDLHLAFDETDADLLRHAVAYRLKAEPKLPYIPWTSLADIAVRIGATESHVDMKGWCLNCVEADLTTPHMISRESVLEQIKLRLRFMEAHGDESAITELEQLLIAVNAIGDPRVDQSAHDQSTSVDDTSTPPAESYPASVQVDTLGSDPRATCDCVDRATVIENVKAIRNDIKNLATDTLSEYGVKVVIGIDNYIRELESQEVK